MKPVSFFSLLVSNDRSLVKNATRLLYIGGSIFNGLQINSHISPNMNNGVTGSLMNRGFLPSLMEMTLNLMLSMGLSLVKLIRNYLTTQTI